MLNAVQQYAPNALPNVAEVLIPDFTPSTDKSKVVEIKPL
jgi:hypothetical protein